MTNAYNPRPLASRSRFLPTGCVFVYAVLTIALAQGQGISVGGGVATRGTQWHTAQATGPVRITPSIATIDPTTHSATLHLINASADTVRATLTTQTAVSRPSHGHAPSASGTSADTTAGVDSSAPRVAEPGVTRGLRASWIQNLPPQVTLAPHETLTVHVHLVIPPHLPPGDYTAALVVTLTAETSPGGAVTVGGDDDGSQGQGNGGGGHTVSGDVGTLIDANGDRAMVQISLGTLTANDGDGARPPDASRGISRSTLVYHCRH